MEIEFNGDITQAEEIEELIERISLSRAYSVSEDDLQTAGR